MADKTNNIIYRIEVDSKSGKINIDGITKGFEQADKSFSKLKNNVNKGLGGLNSTLKQTKNASGGATASVMEMGRVISDAPYGIRGMANNLTQLVSQMGFTVKSAGSLKLALKEMWAAMMGPLGIVLAITTVISALDFFAGSTKKAKKESDALSKTFGENSTKLMVLKSALDDSNMSLEDKNELVKKANEEFEDLNIKIDENGRLTDESAEAIDRLSLSFIKNAKAKAIAGLIQEEMAAQAKLSVESIGTQIGYLEGFSLAAMAAFSGGQQAFSAFLKKDSDDRAEVMDDSKERIERYVSMLKKNGGELAKALFGDESSTKKKNREKAKLVFDTKDLTKESLKYVKELMKVDEKIALMAAKDKKSRLIIQRDFHLKRLIAAHGANSELVKAYKKYYRELIQTAEDGELELLAKEGAKGMGGAPRDKNKDADDIRMAKLAKLTEFTEKFMEISSGLTSFMDGEFQRQLTTEQNKTNAINNELRERLNNENLSAGERKGIQLKIARNDEALRKKQEEIQKKRFKMQKAANIAMGLADTFKNTITAFGSQLVVGDPTSIARAKIAAKFAAASGLLSVAMIARQKFQSSAGAAPSAGALGSGGGSGGGRGDRSFDFNLAGASRENQLAQTLQGRFDQPLQAYVVARDITNQQQLDEDIRSNASFG